MKIAIINVVGKTKSTGKIATHLSEVYEKLGHECLICYGREDVGVKGKYYKFDSKASVVLHYMLQRITNKEGYYSILSTKRLQKRLDVFRPDKVILLNLHGHYLNIPMIMKYLGDKRIDTTYFMCDEYPFTANCTYTMDCEGYKSGCKNCSLKNAEQQYFDKEKYYDGFDNRIRFASVAYVVNKAKKSTLLCDKKLFIADTGINTDFFEPKNVESMKERYLVKDKICFINVAPYSNARKGLKYFFDAAEIMKDDERFVFINVGYDGDGKDIPKNMIVIPFVNDQDELAHLYSLADAYVCTSIADALPNAAVEAMSCGTPVIAFNIAGMPYLADSPILTLVDNINGEALAEILKGIGKKNDEIISMVRTYTQARYDFEVFAKKLLS